MIGPFGATEPLLCGNIGGKTQCIPLSQASPAQQEQYARDQARIAEVEKITAADRAAAGTKPFYKKLWFWGVVAGVGVAGTGAYLALRR